MWWAAMRACARCSWHPRGFRSSWSSLPSRPTSAGPWVVRGAGLRDEAIGTAGRHTFDLAIEIPMRAILFRVAEDEHVLVAVLHHIAADGLSIAPLVRDVAAGERRR